MLRAGWIQGEGSVVLVSKQNLTPPIDAFGALKIVNIRVELKKLLPSKVEGVQELRKTNHRMLQS
jgi:hypothetical protein